jgi:hypothetical protein
VGQSLQIPPLEQQLVGLDAPRIGNESHQGQHADALAGSGFADNPEHLAFFEHDVDAIHGAHHPVLGRKCDRQIFNLEQRHQIAFNTLRRFSFENGARPQRKQGRNGAALPLGVVN